MVYMKENERKIFYENLESEGEESVRKKLNTGHYGQPLDTTSRACLIKEWLNTKERNRKLIEKEENKKFREIEIQTAKESNDLAHEANKISHGARKIAGWALFVAILSLIATIVVALIKQRWL